MSKREPLTKRMRFAVLERDGFTCRYCGAQAPDVVLHVDHHFPVAEGGRTVFDNLVTACEPCNLGKGAKPLSEGVNDVQVRAIAASMMAIACDRWPGQLPPDAFAMLLDFSRINGPQPQLITLVRLSSSWAAAEANLYRQFGYPEEFWSRDADNV